MFEDVGSEHSSFSGYINALVGEQVSCSWPSATDISESNASSAGRSLRLRERTRQGAVAMACSEHTFEVSVGA